MWKIYFQLKKKKEKFPVNLKENKNKTRISKQSNRKRRWKNRKLKSIEDDLLELINN